VTVKNTGELAGKEVIQIYVSKLNSKIDRPDQELKAFAKTRTLQPGEQQAITLHIPVSDLAYWNEGSDRWTLEKGQYEIKIAASTWDIKEKVEIEL